MRTGKLRHRVTHQRATEEADDYGQQIKTWSTVGTYSGELRGQSAREATIAGQAGARSSHTLTLRAIRSGALIVPDVRPGDRFTFQGRTLNVSAPPLTDPRERELIVTLIEVVEP